MTTRRPPNLLRRATSVFVLALIFLRELLLSSVSVARAAFARNVGVKPAIIAVPITLRTDAGISTLANLVSLTPGTTSLEVSADRKTLYVHCLDAPSADDTIADIKRVFETRIREIEG